MLPSAARSLVICCHTLSNIELLRNKKCLRCSLRTSPHDVHVAAAGRKGLAKSAPRVRYHEHAQFATSHPISRPPQSHARSPRNASGIVSSNRRRLSRCTCKIWKSPWSSSNDKFVDNDLVAVHGNRLNEKRSVSQRAYEPSPGKEAPQPGKSPSQLNLTT